MFDQLSSDEKKQPEVTDRVFKTARSIILGRTEVDKELEVTRKEVQELKKQAKFRKGFGVGGGLVRVRVPSTVL